MSASLQMPYFIKPSLRLTREEKIEAYEIAVAAIHANLFDAKNDILKMSTINCILKTHLPYFYWIGFYIHRNSRLEVGPYQGTLGCLYIDFERGVCGKAARTRSTQIVEDCHALIEGADHITCDPNSQSEIVVPVINRQDELIAVFDIDSTLKNSFDAIDQKYLEQIVQEHFN